MELLNAREEHYEKILEYNEILVDVLSPMDMDKMLEMKEETSMFKVVVENDKVCAFLMAFENGTSYDSVNYKWFEKEYEKFLYIDRIVIPEEHQRKGIGKMLYDEVFSFAKEKGVDTVTCEIDIKPSNPKSLAFHKEMGFEEVGSQVIKGGEKEVSLQAKRLD